jgi:drug/metabolite transporter (DMT)-like permease
MSTTTTPDTVASAVEVRHVVWLLVLGLIWGSSYLFIKLLVDAVSPAVMVSVRFGMGAAALGAVLGLRGGRLPGRGIIWFHLAVMSLFVNVVPFLLIAWGSQHAESALAAVLNGSTPLFALLFAAAVFRSEVFTLARVSGVLLGFAGVIALTGGSLRDLGSTASLGELALLLSSVCYGFGFAYARQFVKGDPLSNVTAQLLIGLAITTPIALTTGWVRTEHLHAGNIAAWIVLGVFGTGIAYLFYYSLIGQIGATRASLVTYITPVVGVILGWIVLRENLGLTGIAGMLLIIAGVAISYGWHKRLRRRSARTVETCNG